jgi:hypothetical protein
MFGLKVGNMGWLRVGKRWKGYGWEKGEGLRVVKSGRVMGGKRGKS